MINDNKITTFGIIPTNTAQRIPAMSVETEWTQKNLSFSGKTATFIAYNIIVGRQLHITNLSLYAQMVSGSSINIRILNNSSVEQYRLYEYRANTTYILDKSLHYSMPHTISQNMKLEINFSGTITVVSFFATAYEETL